MTLPTDKVTTFTGALRRYVDHRIEPGSFLRAVLEDRLALSVLLGDDDSRRCLADICRLVQSTVPAPLRGSPDAVARHLTRRPPAAAEAAV